MITWSFYWDINIYKNRKSFSHQRFARAKPPVLTGGSAAQKSGGNPNKMSNPNPVRVYQNTIT
jgi:hypothetical protein